MIDFTNAPARALVAAVCMALSSQVASAQAVNATPVRKSSLGLDIYEASEVVLGKLCMESRYDRRPMADLAKREAALAQRSTRYPGTGPNDTVYRVGPITTQVYAVDWADGTCSARASGGDPEKRTRPLMTAC